MQQRRATAGRPSGTDGFDFNYRMVVDSRYTKVAKGKSHLKSIFIAQTVLQVIGSLLIVLASQEKGFDNLAVVFVSVEFISLLFGELGRRRSQANLLRLYLCLSTVATASKAAHVFISDLFLKILAIMITILLMQNMSPKRTS